MAHTLRKVNLGNTAIAQVSFTSYIAGQGGEQFTLAEFGLTGALQSVEFLQTVDAATGAECPARYTRYMGGGKVMLMDVNMPSNELTSSPSLNWKVTAVITGT